MKLETKFAVAFVLGLLIVGAVGIQSYLGIQRLTDTNRGVIHTHEVLEKLEQVLSALKDAETGQRGFVLTGEERYLDPYTRAAGEIQKDIDSVESLTKDNPEQQKSLQQLQKLSRDKLDELQGTVMLRRETGMEAALPVIRSDRGKRIMDDIRILVAQMERRERQLLDAQNHSVGEVAQRSLLTLGFGVLLSLMVLGIAAVIVTGTMRLADRSRPPQGVVRKWPRIAIRYAFAVAVVALSTGLRWWLVGSVGPMPLFVTWYPAVLLVATIAGGGPGIVATLLSALAADYWFIEPYRQFSILGASDAVATGIFTGTGIFLSILAERLRRARWAEAVSVTQEQELALLNMGNLLALDLDHRIVRWSEGCRRLYGFDARDAQGQLTHKLLQTHFAQPLEQIHSDLLEKGHWEGEVTRRRKDGAKLSLMLLWALRRDEQGKPLAILEVSTDITRQKIAEESLRQQSEELAQQNEELTQQSEELTQQAEELSEQNEELQTQSEEIQALNAELGHREKMLQTLLDSARLPIGEQEVMGKICRAAMEMIGQPATVTVVCERHGDELQILAHAGFDGADVPGSWAAKGSFVELMMQQNRTVSLEDTSLRPDLNILNVPGHRRFAAVLSSPLNVKGKCIGAVSIYSNKTQQWTVEQFRLIEWLAAQCSNSLEAMRLAAEVLQGQKHNEFLASILEASSQAFGVGYPDGRLGLINKAFEQLTGYSGEELRSINWARTLTPPEWREIERQKLEELYRTGLPVRYEKEYIRKDGARVPIDLLVHLVKDAEGKPLYYYSFLTDITERKRAEADMERLARQRQLALDAARLGWWHYNPLTRIASWDDRYKEIFGVTGYQRPNDEILTRLHSDDLPRVWASVEAALDPRNPQPYATEYRINLPDGSMKWIEAHGIATFEGEESARRAISFVGTVADITERKRAEEALRESEERHRLLAETMLQGVVHQDADGRIIAMNPAAERILGKRREQFLGSSSVQEEQHTIRENGQPFPGTEHPSMVALRTGHQMRGVIMGVFNPKVGEYRWISIDAVPLCRPGQTCPSEVYTVFDDITERKRAQDALRRTAEELSRSNKELEQFAYVASHDLQEPLRMVTAFAGLLQKHYQGQLDEQANEYLAFTVEGAERMQALVHDLLDYSRVSARSSVLVPTNAQESLDAALANLKVSIKESDAKITYDPLPTVKADGSQLARVFQNLIGNAIKFRKADVPSEIHVGVRRVTNAECGMRNADYRARSAECHSEPGKMETSSTPNSLLRDPRSNVWLFSVRDNGIGIESQFGERIFEVFQRLHTREVYPGNGIGLAICKKIVERHGGRIWVESEPGNGSTFFFTLPEAPQGSAG
jgi:PAS domain S-box-containing protein